MRSRERLWWEREKRGRLEKSRAGGRDLRFFDCLFFFVFIFCVCLSSCPLWLFFVFVVVRGRGKAMALQRNVVYTVTRWMGEWMGWWMDGCMLLKTQKPTRWGLEQELDACLITVSLCLSGVSLFKFLSSCTGEKEGLLRKPSWHEDSPVLFCHFFLLISFEKLPF